MSNTSTAQKRELPHPYPISLDYQLRMNYYRSQTHLSELCNVLKFDIVETVFAAHRCVAFSSVFRHADGWGLA